MAGALSYSLLRDGCADTSFDAGLRLTAELEPIAGPGEPVKPAVYAGGRFQQDKRWEQPGATEPVSVIVIDNTPSQANRLEAALQLHRGLVGCPEFVIDLSGVANLPAHLPTRLSSFQFPHRNADAYLRDSQLAGEDFIKTEVGKQIFDATPATAGALVSWFPQALLYGFWQSHLGKKRANTKHARAWVSEIVGWRPAASDTRVLGVKGDPLNLSIDDAVLSNPDDREEWVFGAGISKADAKALESKADKLSEMGHGQVPFSDGALAGVSFARVSQLATLSFAQLRRISLGESSEADAAARALLAALGVFAHVEAFGRAFALRSGADLRIAQNGALLLGASGDHAVELPSGDDAVALVREAYAAAETAGVPLTGWHSEPVVLTPKKNLSEAIRASWPLES